MQHTTTATLVGIIAFCCAAATASAESTAVPPPPPAPAAVQSATLSPGDKVKITVFNVPEITGEYTVGPGGEISLPLLGRVDTGGLTPDQLTDLITLRLSAGYVKNPKVTVAVADFRPFYILGEINHPGEFPYKATMTVEQAIAAAGGYTFRAARHTAFLRRAGGPETRVRLGDQPIYVQPGDTIRIGVRYF